MLSEIRPMSQKDPNTIKYLVFIFIEFGQNKKGTDLLESVAASNCIHLSH